MGNFAANFDADHFTWWMVAKPIAAAGCFDVTVMLDGKPAAGADLFASSWTAGALSKATSGDTGKACLEGVVGAGAQVGAKVGELTAIVEAPAPAAGTCGGTCTPVTIALQSGTACVNYTISGGNATGGKLVWATDKGAAGAIVLTGPTGCLPVPASAQVTLVASNGTLFSLPQQVAGLSAAACGGACTALTLTLPAKSEPVDEGGCVSAPDGAPCDDENGCTAGDQCLGGGCAGVPKSCNDGDLCTQNSCDAGTGKCNYSKIEGCVVGQGCQQGSAAQCAGACAIAGPAIATAIADTLAACVTQACPTGDAGCKTAALTGACAKESAACTAADTDKDGESDLLDCAPLDPFANSKASEQCDGKDNNCDGSVDEASGGCGQGLTCVAASCVPATADNGCKSDAECDDGKACTADFCTSYACTHAPVPGCNGCTTPADCPSVADPCKAWTCTPDNQCLIKEVAGTNCSGACTGSAECEDGDACTDNYCVTGACKSLPASKCTGNGNTCKAILECLGQCIQGPSPSLKNCSAQCSIGQSPEAITAFAAIQTCLSTTCPSDSDITCMMNASDSVCKPQFEACKGPPACLTDAECDDGDSCTQDKCNGDGCAHWPNGSDPKCQGNNSCQNDNECPGAQQCQKSVCQGGFCYTLADPSQPGCNGGCQNDAECEDGNPCSTNKCEGGQCNSYPSNDPNCGGGTCQGDAQCEDGNPCSINKCEGGKCNSYPSNDPNCGGGTCQGDAQCEDGNPCSINKCEGGKCVQSPSPDPQCNGGCQQDYQCEDADPCTTNTCKEGKCISATSQLLQCAKCTANSECNDLNPCTTDTCTASKCVNTPTTSGVGCGACTGASPTECDDKEPCTADYCGGTACLHIVQVGQDPSCSPPCAADADCGKFQLPYCQAGTCNAGKCSYGFDKVNCCQADSDCPADADPCTKATCAGTCSQQPIQGCGACTDAATCNDYLPCTTDSCDGGLCAHKNNPSQAGCCVADSDCPSDGNPCTQTVCQAGNCYSGPKAGCGPCGQDYECNDQDSCTTDSCKEGQCAHAPSCPTCTTTADCADDDLCAVCTDKGTCLKSTWPAQIGLCGKQCGGDSACDDGDPCTKDTCDAGTCKAGGPKDCADDNACTLNEYCLAGFGCNSEYLNCPEDNDGNVCTFQQCEPASGCVLAYQQPYVTCDNVEAPCVLSSCGAFGVCTPTGEVIPCAEDGNACTQHTCEMDFNIGSKACVQKAAAITCDDGNPCTASDNCSGTSCVGGASPCNDNNPCTDDSCTAGTGACVYTPNNAPCTDDGNVCTFDVCAASACSHPANQEPCADDGNACTGDVCADTACSHPVLTGTPCEEGNVCTSDTCNSGECVSGEARDGPCEDGEPCTANDTCAGGSCTAGGAKNCNDQNDCTADSCQQGVGCKHAPKSNAEYCDKGCKIEAGSSCKDCGGYNCFGELQGSHYCGNPAGFNAGICQP